ncbi:MAG: hypothetical protein GJU76_06830 [Gallionella sp.]|jgi:hypothetical protein|nr:hypothetical protein [Gallionella sp.]
MNKKMIGVMRHRAELLARIAGQRGQVVELGTRWQVPLALADQGLIAAHYVRSHPVLIAAVAALVAMRRRGVAGMARGAWRLWKTYRTVSILAKNLASRF